MKRYIINNIQNGIPDYSLSEIKKELNELKNKGALIVDFFEDQNLWTEPDSFSSINFDGSKYDELTAGVL